MDPADRRDGEPPRASSPSDAATQTFLPGAGNATVSENRFSLGPGQHFGHYEILRPLGRGGMGEVYEATDLENGRHVALKTSRNALHDEAHRARFLREGRLAASISHPNTVYVFKTEEIDGIPVIATEIAASGSLKDRVAAGGPLAPAEAVDAILEVIAGLEAAAAVGVLHRDIKPSNCFVDSEGRIKVGDFGLSILTLGQDETQITRTGGFVGTPTFASPEQLRGEVLDVRSDIYAVGATLYYLLAGHEPFADGDAVRRIARALQEAPEPLGRVRCGVPRALEKVVLQCLAKDPADRPQTYVHLTKLLQPYTSISPKPATPGQRALAGGIDLLGLDMLVVRPLRFILWMQWMQGPPTSRVAIVFTWLLPGAAVAVGYYTLSEWLWSGSLGKRLVGLRVVSASHQPIGAWRSFARALLWALALWFPGSLGFVVAFGPDLSSDLLRLNVWSSAMGIPLIVTLSLELIGLGILFCTSRRDNGFAGLHDLVTRTRIVLKPAVDGTPVARGPELAPVVSPDAARLGPYVVLDQPLASAGVIVGFDERLRRKVWIRQLLTGTPAVSPARRDLNRAGRLRWLNGRRDGNISWDAYEAVAGEPLPVAGQHPRSWVIVRRWLGDLADEITSASTEGTRCPLVPDAVWVADNRARILDWRPNDIESAPTLLPGPDTVGPDGWQAFLSDVATIGLGAGGQEAAGSPRSMCLPLHAREFLADLSAARFQAPADVVQRLKSFARRPGTLTRRRRGAHLAACCVIPLLILFLCLALAPMAGRSLARAPDIFVIDRCLQRLEELDRSASTPDNARERSSIESYLVGHFRAKLVSQPEPTERWLWPFIEARRPIVQRALARHFDLSDQEVGEGMQLAALVAAGRGDHDRATRLLLHWQLPVFVLLSAIALVTVSGLLSALVARGGIMMRQMDIAILGPDGREVSRSRAFGRSAIAWMPAIASFILVMPPFIRGPLADVHVERLVPSFVMLSMFAAGAVMAFLNPQRGPQDWLVGTRLVAR